MNIRVSFLLLVLLFVNQSAHATVIYTADASSTFTLISAGGMSITAESMLEPAYVSLSGSATGSVDADTPSVVVPASPFSSLTLESAVSGSASPGFGTSFGEVLNGFLITLVNPGDTAAVAEFTFEYFWEIEVVQTDPIDALNEMGFASAFFHLDGFAPSGSETLAIDDGSGAGPVSVPDWLINPVVELSISETDSSVSLIGSALVTAFVTVPGMSTDQFSVITDAIGAAEHIPEPGTLVLLLVTTTLLGLRRHS